jgi:hypothetical protein
MACLAPGGFIGGDHLVFVFSVLSHAPGIFSLVITESASVATAVDLVAGQKATVTAAGAGMTWTYTGSGAAFRVGAGASLGISGIALAGPAGSALLAVEAGGRLSVEDSWIVQPAVARAEWVQPVALPCDGGADGRCLGPHAGAVALNTAASVSLAVPLLCGFWTEDCAALPAGVTADQHAAGLAAGIAWNADAVCFQHGVADGGGEERQALEQKERAGVLTAAEAARLQTMRRASVNVPDDPNFLVSAGVGIETKDWLISPYNAISSFDPSMPPAWRCDATAGTDYAWYNIEGRAEGRGPFALNRSGTGPRWYRLPAGKGLPTAPPGVFPGGTAVTGWLSGWPAGAEGQPEDDYATPADGSLPPPVGRPPAAGTVCFDGNSSFTSNNTCYSPTTVRAVACGAFALWELPAAPSVPRSSFGNCYGYCLAPDPCAGCAAAGRCAAESWAGGADNGGGEPSGGRCACTAGWAGVLCGDALPAGVGREQHDRAVAAGVDPVADAVCFTATFLTVPDDPHLLVSAGQGGAASVDNYDPSLPPAWRCDAAEGVLGDQGAGSQWKPLGDAGSHGPFGLRQGGGAGDAVAGPRWYRLPAGKGLPTAPPGGIHIHSHCGTDFTSWLSGWPAGAEGQPGEDYATPADGSLPPPVGRPPAAGTVCFASPEGGHRFTCSFSTAVRAVACGAFALWELPAAVDTRYPLHGECLGYCLDAA